MKFYLRTSIYSTNYYFIGRYDIYCDSSHTRWYTPHPQQKVTERRETRECPIDGADDDDCSAHESCVVNVEREPVTRVAYRQVHSRRTYCLRTNNGFRFSSFYSIRRVNSYRFFLSPFFLLFPFSFSFSFSLSLFFSVESFTNRTFDPIERTKTSDLVDYFVRKKNSSHSFSY